MACLNDAPRASLFGATSPSGRFFGRACGLCRGGWLDLCRCRVCSLCPHRQNLDAALMHQLKVAAEQVEGHTLLPRAAQGGINADARGHVQGICQGRPHACAWNDWAQVAGPGQMFPAHGHFLMQAPLRPLALQSRGLFQLGRAIPPGLFS